MDSAKQWWAGLDMPRRWMVIALALMTFSHFMDYVAPHTEQSRIILTGVYTTTATGGTAGVEEPVPGQSGWEVHPNVWIVLGALAVLFGTGLDLGQWWKNWGYWIGALGLVTCLFPFDTENLPGWGFLVGVVAVGIGIRAAMLHGRAIKPV